MSLAGSAPLSSGGSGQGPTLAPAFVPKPAKATGVEEETISGSDDKKKLKKHRLFGFGKKKADGTAHSTPPSIATSVSTPPATATPPAAGQVSAVPVASPTTPGSPPVLLRKPSSVLQTESTGGGMASTGPIGHGYHMSPASPVRSLVGMPSSPRLSSPSGSQIFERDVQESTMLVPSSPAIPSHITTENRIPPVLDASSEAITDDHLDPDSVEIITHAHHQPAMLAVASMSSNSNCGMAAPVASSAASGASMGAWVDEVASSFGDKDDGASNYGSFDTTDVRRLSFISFADVVQAEQHHQHQQQQQQLLSVGSSGNSIHESMHMAGLTSLTTLGPAINRSPSPMRSPTATVSTGCVGTSPPTSKSGSIKGLEMSPPSRKATMGSTYSSAMGSPAMSAVGGPISGNLLLGGELAVETMSQALRRTGSGDLSGLRSVPQSPIEGSLR